MKLKNRYQKLNQKGVLHHVIPIVAFLVLFGSVGAYFYATSSKAATIPELRSGMVLSGQSYCLDDHGDGDPGASSVVDAWACNGTPAQVYSYDSSDSEIHVGKGCVVPADAKSATTGFTQEPVILTSQCGEGQAVPWGGAWTMFGNSSQGYVFENNHADSKAGNGTWCLDITGAKADAAVEIYHCNQQPNQAWYPDTFNGGTGGGTTGGTGGGTTAGSATGIGAVGYFTGLIEANSDKSGVCLTATGDTEGSDVNLTKCSQYVDTHQIWISASGGSYKYGAAGGTSITDGELKLEANTSECLDDWQQADTNDSKSLKLYPCTPSSGVNDSTNYGDLWWRANSGDYTDQLINVGAFNRTSGSGAECLDNQAAENSVVDMYDCKTNSEGNTNQRWYLDVPPSSFAPTQTPTTQTPTQSQTQLSQSQAQVNQENQDLETIIQSLPADERGQITCSELQSQYARALFDCPQTN